MQQDIILTVDYHDQKCSVRWLNRATDRRRVLTIATHPEAIGEMVDEAAAEAKAQGGQVVWIQESTTGWARVRGLLAGRAVFHLSNTAQMPQSPRGRRRKTDKTDTARMQREYLNGELPLSYQPPEAERQLRRLVAFRENLVARRTALRNWINRYLAHELWADRVGLWSQKGRRRLQALTELLPRTDAWIIGQKLAEHDLIDGQLAAVGRELLEVHRQSPHAQRVDAIKGIGMVAAVSIVARIGPVSRFRNAEQLIGYAGLAPGLHESDGTRRDGPIGGGSTDRRLRHYLLEASVWARQLPRYRDTYARLAKRRGPKIGRLQVARMLLRSIYKMLRDGVAFTPGTTIN